MKVSTIVTQNSSALRDPHVNHDAQKKSVRDFIIDVKLDEIYKDNCSKEESFLKDIDLAIAKFLEEIRIIPKQDGTHNADSDDYVEKETTSVERNSDSYLEKCSECNSEVVPNLEEKLKPTDLSCESLQINEFAVLFKDLDAPRSITDENDKTYQGYLYDSDEDDDGLAAEEGFLLNCGIDEMLKELKITDDSESDYDGLAEVSGKLSFNTGLSEYDESKTGGRICDRQVSQTEIFINHYPIQTAVSKYQDVVMGWSLNNNSTPIGCNIDTDIELGNALITQSTCYKISKETEGVRKQQEMIIQMFKMLLMTMIMGRYSADSECYFF